MTHYSYRLLRNTARRFCVLILLLSAARVTNAQTTDVAVGWRSNSEPDLAGYRLYYGNSPGVYDQQIDAGLATIATVPNLSIGSTYFFAVTAYNLMGLESAFSPEISYTVPSQTPTPTPTPTASPNPLTISGAITYCSNPAVAPVPGVTLALTGGQLGSTMSDGSGNYLFASLLAGGNYIVTPTKSRLLPGSPGISTIDVVAIQRYFLNFGTIPPGCQLSAADVNGDTVINTADVIAVQRFALGLTSGIGNVGVYQFTPTSRAYLALAHNQSGQDYGAFIFGDVASGFVYREGGPSSGPPQISTAAEVDLPEVIVDLSVTNFTVAVTATAINGRDRLVGFQGDFTFDETVVSFADNPVENADLTINWNVSANILPGPGPIRTLRVSGYSNDLQPLSGSGALFNLNMIRVSNVPSSSTGLTWAETPGEFIFVDAGLNPRPPSSAAPGTITFEQAPSP